MKLFECQHCGQLLYFENTRCGRCGHVLGYSPDLYPFVLAPTVIGKLRFVHGLIHREPHRSNDLPSDK